MPQEEAARHFKRIQFSCTAELSANNQSWETKIQDLSLNGALIYAPTECNLDKNTDCTLSFKLDNDIVITMQTTLVNIKDHLLGLRMHHIDAESMGHLRRMIELNTGDPSLLERELHELVSVHKASS
jgi:hypothetical protein